MQVENWMWTILIGFIVGALAKFIMPGKDPGGCIITILIGIGGAYVASYLGPKMGFYTEGQPASFLGSLVGALLILLVYRVLAGRRR